MRATNWTAPTSDAIAARRAGGRKRHNAERQAVRDRRRELLARIAIARGGWWFAYRNGAELARTLGVSRATICRDLHALMREDC